MIPLMSGVSVAFSLSLSPDSHFSVYHTPRWKMTITFSPLPPSSVPSPTSYSRIGGHRRSTLRPRESYLIVSLEESLQGRKLLCWSRNLGEEEARKVKALIRWILQYDPAKRPSAAEILSNPWFCEVDVDSDSSKVNIV